MQKFNTRMCILTREKKDPSLLLRLKKKDGTYLPSLKGEGRGVYVSYSLFEEREIKNRLEKRLHTSWGKEEWEEIQKWVKKNASCS